MDSVPVIILECFIRMENLSTILPIQYHYPTGPYLFLNYARLKLNIKENHLLTAEKISILVMKILVISAMIFPYAKPLGRWKI